MSTAATYAEFAAREAQFGVVRFLGGPVEDPTAFHDYAVANWPAIEAELRARATQTNEAGRCAVLLPDCASTPIGTPTVTATT